MISTSLDEQLWIKTLFPSIWLGAFTDDKMSEYVEFAADNYLNQFYLFPLEVIEISNKDEEVTSTINHRLQSLISSAYALGITVTSIVRGYKGKITYFLGFKAPKGSKFSPSIFEALVRGEFPGSNVSLAENTSFTSVISGFNHSGLLSGIPIVWDKDKGLFFNIAPVTRSLHQHNYVIVTIARPIPAQTLQDSFSALLEFRDACHREASKSIALGHSEQKGTNTSSSKTTSHSGNVSIIFAGYQYSKQKSEVTGESRGVSTSTQTTIEEQSGNAIEFETISNTFIERFIRGFNIGFWETSVSFMTEDEIGGKILNGSLIGELSKSSEKIYSQGFRSYQVPTPKLLIPKVSETSSVFPNALSSYLNSEELTQIASMPCESLPGFEIRRMPELSYTDMELNNQFEDDKLIRLGKVTEFGTVIEESNVCISHKDINKHVFVCGLTGSGKTTTVKSLIKNAYQSGNIPFLVIESAKRDYRQLLTHESLKTKLQIFTVGDSTVNPLRINLFYIQQGIHPLSHIDNIKSIFNASFSLYGPMPYILEKCLHRIYEKKGWNLSTGIHPFFTDPKGLYSEEKYKEIEHLYCFPTLSDLKTEVDEYVKNELEYRGELRDNIRTAIITRIESLCVGSKGTMFNTSEFFNVEKLLSNPTILELETLSDDDDKAFFVGLILVLISEYRQRENPTINPGVKNKGLRHILVLEEAHRLLKNIQTERTNEMVGNPKGKAVESFCNAISEMRSLGQGVIVVEQIPSKIAPDVIKNSNTKIVHRLVSRDDQLLLAGSLNLQGDDSSYMARLKTGHALVGKEGMALPIECSVYENDAESAISDDRIKREMKNGHNYAKLHFDEVYELSSVVGESGQEICVQLLNTLCVVANKSAQIALDRSLKMIKAELTKKGLQHKFTEEIIKDYVVNGSVKLFSSGLYSKNFTTPLYLKRTLCTLITHFDDGAFAKLTNLLSVYWSVTSVDQYISEVVKELVVRYLYLSKAPWTHEKIVDTVRSFFFMIDDENLIKTVEHISKNVVSYYD